MKILAIDTSCDETSAAVTDGLKVLSNVVWSQASLHARWGGVVPSLAQREHRARIDWVVQRALKKSVVGPRKVGAIAVTIGPCLAIAGEVGIKKAKDLAREWQRPVIVVNHIEGHLLSPLILRGKAKLENWPHFPALGLVISGGHTELIYIKQIGEYQIVASTIDDALGEALDKAARAMGLGYPGGAILEKMAREGNPKSFPLPLPMRGKENQQAFSYSGLKTAFWRLINEIKGKRGGLSERQIHDLAASFQNVAFEHLLRIIAIAIKEYPVRDLLVGGGVSANIELRKRLRKFGRSVGFMPWFPLRQNLCTDNAAMIGVAAGFKVERQEMIPLDRVDLIDRVPRARIDRSIESYWQQVGGGI